MIVSSGEFLLHIDRLQSFSPDCLVLIHFSCSNNLGLLQLGAVLNTLRFHPLVVILPESAGLTSLAGTLVNGTVASKLAAVVQLLCDGSSEESLASLTRQDVVMPAGGSVSTHHTDLSTLHHLLLPLGQLLRLLLLLMMLWRRLLRVQSITDVLFGLGWVVEVGVG